MRRYKLAILGLALSLGAVVGVTTASQAKWSDSIQNQDKVTVAADQTRSGSLYASGDQIVIDGTVEGDLYCAGRELIIKGEVTGDVLCAVQTTTVEGAVGQDMRLAGQYASVNGEVGGSLTFFGQDLKLLADSSVGGDINGAAQFVTLGGPVERDVLIGAEQLTLQSTVGGNVNVGATRVQLMGGAQVAGDLNYAAESRLSIDESRVGGEVTHNPIAKREGSGIGWLIFFATSLILSALIIAALVPRFVDRTRAVAGSRFGLVALVGFTVVFGTPILAILLTTTIVLIPLAILLMLLWLSVLILSNTFFAYWLGSLMLPGRRHVLLRMLAGIVLLAVLYMIPGINVFAASAAMVIGAGMLAMTALNGYRRPSYDLGAASTAKKRK